MLPKVVECASGLVLKIVFKIICCFGLICALGMASLDVASVNDLRRRLREVARVLTMWSRRF